MAAASLSRCLRRVAVISVHGSPLAPLGGRESGGMNVYLNELSRELGRRGLQIDLFTRRYDPQQPSIIAPAEGVRIVHLPAGPPGSFDKNALYDHLPEFLYHLLRFAQDQGLRYDVIHSHYWLSGWVGTMLKRRWGVPLVAMFHTLAQVKNQAWRGAQEPALRLRAECRTLAQADRIVAGSVEEQRGLVRYYGVSPARIEVIPCGVDLGVFRPLRQAQARRALGVTDPRVVLFVGRFDPLKGLDLLLRVVAQLQERRGLRLLIIGGDQRSGAEVRRLQALGVSLGIENTLSFVGAVAHDRLPLYYNAADVCVVPSYYESFGMVALEAMACGTPVVAARVGGLQSTVRHGETGFLIPWHCPEPFAVCLEMLLSHRRLREQFGKSGRQVAEQFGWDTIAERVLELYERVIVEQSERALPAAGPLVL